MGKSCCTFEGTNRAKKGSGLSFYRFPKEPDRCAKWIAAIRRKEWTPTSSSRLCSEHLVRGAKSEDPLSPDYVPKIFSFTLAREITRLKKDMSA